MVQTRLVAALFAVALTMASGASAYPWYVQGASAISDFQGEIDRRTMVWFDPGSACGDAYLVITGNALSDRIKIRFTQDTEAFGSILKEVGKFELKPVDLLGNVRRVLLPPKVMRYVTTSVTMWLDDDERVVAVALGGEHDPGNAREAISQARAECERRINAAPSSQ